MLINYNLRNWMAKDAIFQAKQFFFPIWASIIECFKTRKKIPKIVVGSIGSIVSQRERLHILRSIL